MTRNEAIAMKCLDCIYDPTEDGTWRQQTQACEITDCALWQYRPKSRAKMPTIAHSVAVDAHYEPKTAELGV